MREKLISLPGLELVVRMDEHRATRLSRRWYYRFVVSPILRLLESSGGVISTQPSSASQIKDPAIPVVYPRPAHSPSASTEYRSALREALDHKWYHTLDLGQGIRTEGAFDHQPALSHFPIPERLDGMRCLDVATLDGFWAFELERRGAAEVHALDIESWMDLDVPAYVLASIREKGLDLPTGAGFQIAAKLLGSRVKRMVCNVYDLSPAAVGSFDLVVCSDLLLHITNPIRALQRICSVTRGAAIFVEPIVPELDGLGQDSLMQLEVAVYDSRWWRFSRSFLEKAIQLAGFDQVVFVGSVDIRQRFNPEVSIPRGIFHAVAGGLKEPARHTVVRQESH